MSTSRAQERNSKRNMNPRRWLFPLFCLLGLWPILAALFICCSSPAGDGAAKPSVISRRKTLCWILIDFDTFFCSPCLAPLLEFCQALPGPIQEERLRGILVYSRRSDGSEDSRHARIVQTKMQGFIKANDIRFPIVLDEHHLFNGLLKSNTQAFLFDDQRQVVRKFSFPFQPGEKSDILKLLLSNDGG